MGRWHGQKTVYQGRIIRIKAGEWQTNNGHKWAFDIVEHHGGVGVVPLLGDRVLLVRQHRPVVGEDVVEIPAGKLEGPDDDIIERAQAELSEEVGYRAGRLLPVARFYVSPGYCTEQIHVYLGLDLEPVVANPELSEEIVRIEMSLAEVRQRLEAGEFHDSKTIIGLRALLAYLDKEGEPYETAAN